MALSAQRLPDDLQQAVNQARQKAGEFYQFTEDETPLLIQSQDGTASGKTFSVFYQYLRAVNPAVLPGQGHRNLVFITPLKSQIDLPAEIIGLAERKQVKILPFLSIGDLADLAFIPWGQEQQGEEATNKNRYQRWIKQATGLLKRSLNDGPNAALVAFNRLEEELFTHARLERRLSEEADAGFIDEQQLLQDQLDKSNFNLVRRLQEACVELLNGLNTDIEALMTAAEHDLQSKAQLAVSMLQHLFPFQAALYQRCILLATTKKFDGSVTLLRQSKEGHFVHYTRPLDCLLGQKKVLPDNPLGELAQLPDGERIDALKTQYFVHDADSPVALRDIRFTLVLDEEHDAYAIFQQNVTKILLSDDVQLPSLLATLHRVIEFVDECADDPRAPNYEALKDYIDEIKKALAKCDLRADFELKQLTQLFQNTLLDVVVDGRNTEQVIALIGNVFSHQIQRFYREDDLRRIRLRSHGRYSYTEMYVAADDADDNNFSLYELYQTVTAVLAASATLVQPSRVQHMLSQQELANHNNPLSRFIGKAQAIKGEAKYLLAGQGDHAQFIDDFFTYFQPKTLFSLSPRDQVMMKAEQVKGWILLKFRMELIKELPEISLLRMLYQTRNTVTLLSATAGFPSTYNGQYSRPFLERYASILGFHTRRRGLAATESLVSVRTLRSKIRPVNIEVFDEQQLLLSPVVNEPAFVRVYERWLQLLQPYLHDIKHNRYHHREFCRHLQAVLLAAYTENHSLSIGLSGRFFRVLGLYLDAQTRSSTPERGLVIIDKRQGQDLHRVFEFRPFKDKNPLRVVMFDSRLNREDQVREYLRVDRPDLTICMVSHFKGASTGLNHYVSYLLDERVFQVDFQRLILVCSSYWSQVTQKDTQTGSRSRNTLANYITLLKHYSHGPVLRRVDEFETDLVDSSAGRLLDREHVVELHKTAMQTFGRTERRDAIMEGYIQLPYDVQLNAMRIFRDLKRHPDAQVLLASLSLHNHAWATHALQHLQQASFVDGQQRRSFEHKVEQACQHYDAFEKIFVQQILPQAKAGDSDAIAFNEALRHSDSFQNPQAYIARLQRTAWVKKDPFLAHCIDNFYLTREADWEQVIVAQAADEPYGLTDLASGTTAYQPEKLLPPYHQDMSDNTFALEQKIFSDFRKLKPEPLQHNMPVPKLLPLLMGNIGEWQVQRVLEHAGIQALTPQQVCEQLGSHYYEDFDMYCRVGQQLIAIDAKNWRMGANHRQQGQELHAQALQRLHRLQQLSVNNPQIQQVRAVYLNTRYSRNALNDRAEQMAQEQLFYLNLFKSIPLYEPHHTLKDQAKLRYQLRISPALLALLGAAESDPKGEQE